MIRRLLFFIVIFLSTVAAQSPEQIADDAVSEWASQPVVTPDLLFAMSPEEMCEELPNLFQLNAALPGTQVNMDDRLAHDADEDGRLLFTYPASAPGDRYDIVEVHLYPDGNTYLVEQVGYRMSTESTGMRAWVQTPTAAILFSIMSILVLWLLFSPGPNILKRVLAVGKGYIKEHRRLVIITMAIFYGAFAFGAFLGSGLPAQCATAIMGILEQALAQVGAVEAYGSGNIPRAATLTFYQNFGVVSLSVLFPLAALFAVPGYLFTLVSFTAQAIPFGLVSGAGAFEIATILIVLVLELTAYFLITAGGGMLLVTIFRKGFGAFPLAFRKVLAMLPIAFLLLLVGAWFEAAALLL